MTRIKGLHLQPSEKKKSLNGFRPKAFFCIKSGNFSAKKRFFFPVFMLALKVRSAFKEILGLGFGICSRCV